MRENFILPVIGQIHKNQNGREYCCLSNASYRNEEAAQRAVELGEHQANMVRMRDGWSFTAHGLHQYEDGTVEWNYSTGGAFRKEDLDKCRKMLRGKDPALKKYFDYLDFLRMMGTTNMFGAVPYLQRAFHCDHPEEVTQNPIFRSFQELAISLGQLLTASPPGYAFERQAAARNLVRTL